MYYGSFFRHTDDYEVVSPAHYRVCFSDFNSEWSRGKRHKYLHIWLDVLEDFTIEEVETYLNYLLEYFEFEYKEVVYEGEPFYNKERSGTLPGKLKPGDTHILITIDLNKNSWGKVKFIYHITRMLHEAPVLIDTVKTVLKAKKELPDEFIINLITFFFLCQKPASMDSYHIHVISYGSDFIKLTPKELFDNYITKDYFTMLPGSGKISLHKNKSFKQKLEIYKEYEKNRDTKLEIGR